ncbi:hypothetical protein BG015_010374 [Linnemannia schmuckeri]|uniref:Uncharacterized protein n=1 Tax=Linnemannia schmuckeri TaxID=64567 RepID=A0A9P5RU46_9FUNG|nr:hypothetical protein BG015_010374 [Linnemannia schmuckeri]
MAFDAVKIGQILIIVVALLVIFGFLFWWLPRSFRKDAVAKRPVSEDPNVIPSYVANVDIELQVPPAVVISMPVPPMEDEPLPPAYPANGLQDASPPVPGYDAVPIPASVAAAERIATPERT